MCLSIHLSRCRRLAYQLNSFSSSKSLRVSFYITLNVLPALSGKLCKQLEYRNYCYTTCCGDVDAESDDGRRHEEGVDGVLQPGQPVQDPREHHRLHH